MGFGSGGDEEVKVRCGEAPLATGGFNLAEAFRDSGVRIPPGADLILFAVGDEAGEQGELFARASVNPATPPRPSLTS